MYVWGSGVWGDCWEPKGVNLGKYLQKEDEDELKVEKVEMGGNFLVMQDNEGDVYCWGADYYKEIKIRPESLLSMKIPKKVLSKADKVKDIQAGGSFSICFS